MNQALECAIKELIHGRGSAYEDFLEVFLLSHLHLSSNEIGIPLFSLLLATDSQNKFEVRKTFSLGNVSEAL